MHIREDHITSLAIRLKRNLLSSDEFQRELGALSRQERAALVEYLNLVEKGPLEVHPQQKHASGTSSDAFA